MDINEIKKVLARMSISTLAAGACLGLVLASGS
jgi:hypothetical protein